MVCVQAAVLACVLVYTLPASLAPFQATISRPLSSLEDDLSPGRGDPARHGHGSDKAAGDRHGELVYYYRGM